MNVVFLNNNPVLQIQAMTDSISPVPEANTVNGLCAN